MGAYGSPQLGKFAEYNQKPKKPKSNIPIIVIVLMLIFATNQYLKSMNISFKDLGKQLTERTDILNSSENQAPQTTKIPTIITKTSTGILSNKMGLYIIADKAVENKIKSLISQIENDTNVETINIINIQSSINNIQKDLDILKNTNVDNEYSEYKQRNCNIYQATITIIQNYISTNNITLQNFFQLESNFSEELNESYNELKSLFDQNDIIYEETVKEDGSKQIVYRYMQKY